jgi:hypothetical protein
MKTFTDNAGRTWTVQINVDAIKRVRELVQINLLEVIEGALLERLASDPVLLCDCVYALCKPQADAQSIGDAEFGRAMGGDVIDAASDALLEELIDFFPKGRRTVLKTALAKLHRLQGIAMDAVQIRLESPQLEQTLTEQLKRLEDSSGSVPASSGSIPGDSP